LTKISELILKKVEKLNSLIVAPDQNYTIDFVFSRDFESCTLIEINDPPPTAGTSLFIWDNMEDRKILFEGPLTVRVLEGPVPWSEQTDIHPPLKLLIDQQRLRTDPPVQKNEKESRAWLYVGALAICAVLIISYIK